MAVNTSQQSLIAWRGAGLLVLMFCVWKVVLISALLLAPGTGYDTSTSLLSDPDQTAREVTNISPVPANLSPLLKLVRWDAIYFTQIAQRGYIFEQEWAFGPGFPGLLARLQRGFIDDTIHNWIRTLAFLGTLMSNFCHLLSVLLLYGLSQTIFLQPVQRESMSLGIATLHIISPAGAFLASPFSESLFSFLSFLGFYLYVGGLRCHSEKKNFYAEAQILAAGAVFGVATTVRSNGLLNGGLFLYDAAILTVPLISGKFSGGKLRHLSVICVGGSLTGLGTIIPQYKLYRKYCSLDQGFERRPWCNAHVPSIYTWVQSHYWNVGLLRYWTLPNIPLFLLAAPAIYLLCRSSVRVWSAKIVAPTNGGLESGQLQGVDAQMAFLRRLAVPQALIAVLALFNYHVQIITRLSSGYPLWYLSLFLDIRESRLPGHEQTSFLGPETIVRWMVIYSMVQGVLFASFLPPA